MFEMTQSKLSYHLKNLC
ncbi:hypothetical protein ACT453_46675 [Bacillus sp. D-CC]